MSKMDEILERAAAGAYGEDSDAIGKLAGIVRAANYDRGFGPFICGVFGKTDGGLADGYIICPTYGADAQCSEVYVRKSSLKEQQRDALPD